MTQRHGQRLARAKQVQNYRGHLKEHSRSASLWVFAVCLHQAICAHEVLCNVAGVVS